MLGYMSRQNTYRIESRLGGGGGGSVYRVWHANLQKQAVIKASKSAGHGCAQARRNEFEALKDVRSRYLPQVYEFITEGSNSLTVMEYIEGESFANLLRRGCRFSRPEIIEWYCQLASALETLHRHDICHCDVKPANIMLRPEGDICLIDFNAAFVNGNAARVVSRSPGYASPEQYELYELVERNRKKTPEHVIRSMVCSIDWKRSDIYSLGAAMYHILTGNRQHERAAEVVPIKKIGRHDAKITRIIEKSMRQDPAERYAGATELAKATRRIANHNGLVRVFPQTLY